jgi:RNA polymerase sigma-70 factor (ECF subfamily)
MTAPPTIDELLEHADFLRRLARVLVKDEATAEDLVQDTWVEALRRPPHERGNLRRWLAVVLRRVSSRTVSRRPSRAELAWRRERPLLDEPPDQDLERAAFAREISGHVHALAEPYRSTVLLRFYEGLPPREIARREGCGVNTVNSRLQRGLGLLRQRLDRGHGRSGWQGSLAILFAAEEPRLGTGGSSSPARRSRSAEVEPAAAAPALRSLVRVGRHGWKLAGLGGALALALAMAWNPRRAAGASVDAERVATTAIAAPAASRRGARSAPQLASLAAPNGEVVPGERTPAMPAPDELAVRVVDEGGTPVSGAEVYLLGLGIGEPGVRSTLKFRFAGATDEEGRLFVPLVAGDVAPSYGRRSAALWAHRPGHVNAPVHFVPAPDGAVRDVTLRLGGPDQALHGRVQAAARPVPGARITVGLGERVASEGDVVRWWKPALAQSGPDGAFVVRGLAPGRQRVAVHAPGFAPFETWSDAHGEDGRLALHLEVGCSVAGVVRRPDGTAAAGAVVFVHGDLDRPDWRTRTDAAGAFHLSGLPPGPRQLGVYTEDGSEVAWSLAELRPGEDHVWEPTLRCEPPLRIRLVDEEGRALPDGAVLVTHDATPWCLEPEAIGPGTYTLVAPPPGRFRVLVYRSGEDAHNRRSQPHHEVVLEQHPREPLRIRVPEAPPPRSAVRAIVTRAGGAVPDAATLELIHANVVLGREAAVEAASGEVLLEDVVPGRYLVAVTGGRQGTAVLRGCELRAGETLDLGALTLPETAELTLAGSGADGSILELSTELAGRRRVLDRSAGLRRHELFPGTYRVELRSPQGVERSAELVLGPGEAVAWPAVEGLHSLAVDR